MFASVNKKDVHDAEICWVADQHAEQLEQVLSSLDQRVESLEAEIQKLSALRETLLPELLSGSVSVPTEEGQA